MTKFISILLFSSAFCAQSQVREQEVEEIHVNAVQQEKKRNELNNTTITKKTIQETQPEDVGALIQRFPGISLKSYGGLGGLKTFSFRGLGAQHTTVLLDGFVLQNSQVGQINLGQLQTSNIEGIQLGEKSDQEIAPVSALANGSNLSIQTFEGKPHFNSTKIRLNFKQGSFGQWDNYLGAHFAKSKIGVTLYGKYRTANGNYPYRLKYYDYIYEGVQNNNQLNEFFGGVSFFYRPTLLKKAIRIIYRNSFIDQGLPGAVVLYNSYGKQFLNTSQHQFSADWNQTVNFLKLRYYASYQWDKQIYTDSSFLNAAKFLQTTYLQDNASAGFGFQRNKFGDLIQFYGGMETRFSKLLFSTPNSTSPNRLQSFANLGMKINEKNYTVDFRFTYSYLIDVNHNSKKIKHLYSPILQYERKETGKFNWKWGFFAGFTNRIPSFNEMYYSQVGNQNLIPELAKQIRLSTGISQAKKKGVYTSKLEIYYNHITNKIITIPTKNLFVWSVQNVGKVSASGADFVQTADFQINKKWKLALQGNYSFQYCVDISDKNAPSFRHQLAYIPQHSGIADISIYRKNTGMRLSSVWVGKRYSLNQNISSNEVASFSTLDISLFQTLKWHQKHRFQIQFQVKNCFNTSYVYVRSFAMPGRNYLISLSYEF